VTEPEPEPFRIIDRRGQPKEERKITPPDYVAEFRETNDPLVFVAVLPGNRVPEQQFKMSRLEVMGFKLLAQRATGVGPSGQKAIHAFRMRVAKFTDKAVKVHNQTDGAKVEGPRLVQ